MPSVTALPSDRSSRFYEASGHGKRIAVDYPIGRRFYECIPALLDDPRRLDAMPIVDFAALFG